MPDDDPKEQIIDLDLAWREHSELVGQVAMVWNLLHDLLGNLFAEVVAPDAKEPALAAWQAVQNDRSKRAMLNAACSVALGTDSRFSDEVRWATGQMNSLEDKRNNAVHSPYTVGFILKGMKLIPKVFPSVIAGNQRARNLLGRDLAIELKSYLENIGHLTGFVMLLAGKSRGHHEQYTWPERPSLPRPPQAMAQRS